MAARHILTRPDGVTVVRDNWGRDYIYGPGKWCGTPSGYQNHMCRCDECKAWKAASSKKYYNSEKGRKVRKAAAQRAAAKQREYRQTHAHLAVKTINSIFYTLDKVGTGELTADQAVAQIIKKYGSITNRPQGLK